MICEHCGKEYTNKSGFSNHVIRCPKNPNKLREHLTDTGRERLRQSRINQNQIQWADPVFRKQHQEAVVKAVLANPESYSSSNRGRTKQIIIDGVKLQGQWEVDFYLWAKEAGLNPIRPTEAFRYTFEGERWYHPDFYISSLDLYVEVKGYETDKDRAKWSQFPKKLRIIKALEIKQIRQGCFVQL